MSTVLNHAPVSTNRLAEMELDPSRIASSPRKSSSGTAAPAAAKSTSKVLHLGFDWGTNKSCLKASFAGSQDLLLEEIIPTVVGYAKEGIIDALLPDNATVLFGNEAIRHRLHSLLKADRDLAFLSECLIKCAGLTLGSQYLRGAFMERKRKNKKSQGK